MKKHKKYCLNHNLRNIKASYPYSLDEISTLFGVTKPTIYSWLKNGLKKAEGSYPAIILGKHLKEYLLKAKNKRKHTCQDNEIYCCKCKLPKTIIGYAEYIFRTKSVVNIKAKCATCGTQIYRAISAKRLDYFQKIFLPLPLH